MTTTALVLVDGTRPTFTGRIIAIDARINRQENHEATVTLATDSGVVDVFVPPLYYLRHRDLLVVGTTVAMDVRVWRWRGKTTAMAFGIQAATEGGQ